MSTVSSNDVYSFSKPNRDQIVMVAGLGVEGDPHAGVNVRHRSRIGRDPAQPNLRQVHLIHAELFDEVRQNGFEVEPGQLGENVTTHGLDLLTLPRGTVLRFGPPAADGPERPPAATGSTAVAADADVEGAVSAVVVAAGGAELNEATADAVEALVATARREASVADSRPTVVLTGLRNPCPQIEGFRPGLLKEVVHRDPDGTVVRKAGVMSVVLRGGAVRPGDPITVELPPEPHLPLQPV